MSRRQTWEGLLKENMWRGAMTRLGCLRFAEQNCGRRPLISQVERMTDTEKARHDFRNQLGIILGFAELLLAEEALTHSRRGDVEGIHKAATEALGLLDRLVPPRADLVS